MHDSSKMIAVFLPFDAKCLRKQGYRRPGKELQAFLEFTACVKKLVKAARERQCVLPFLRVVRHVGGTNSELLAGQYKLVGHCNLTDLTSTSFKCQLFVGS